MDGVAVRTRTIPSQGRRPPAENTDSEYTMTPLAYPELACLEHYGVGETSLHEGRVDGWVPGLI